MTRWTLDIRVYYEDTDFSGVVYHANYLKFMERGRTEVIRVLGASHADLFAGHDALAFVVRHMEIDFKASARIDDLLTVGTRVMSVTGARLTFAQQVLRGDAELVTATVEVASVTGAGRPTRFPTVLREALTKAL